jgi:hypothetical protein
VALLVHHAKQGVGLAEVIVEVGILGKFAADFEDVFEGLRIAKVKLSPRKMKNKEKRISLCRISKSL